MTHVYNILGMIAFYGGLLVGLIWIGYAYLQPLWLKYRERTWLYQTFEVIKYWYTIKVKKKLVPYDLFPDTKWKRVDDLLVSLETKGTREYKALYRKVWINLIHELQKTESYLKYLERKIKGDETISQAAAGNQTEG